MWYHNKMERSSPNADADDAGSSVPCGSDVDSSSIGPSRPFVLTTQGKNDWHFWKNSSDTLVIDMVLYAEQWANLMQARIDNGEPLDDIWLETASSAQSYVEAENESAPPVSLHMQLMAARLLRRYWTLGEELHQALDKAAGREF